MPDRGREENGTSRGGVLLRTGAAPAASGARSQLGTPMTPSTAAVPSTRARPITYWARPDGSKNPCGHSAK